MVVEGGGGAHDGDVSLDSIPTILALLHTYFFMPRVGICAFIGDIVLQYQQF
jgi:hypothetical protein